MATPVSNAVSLTGDSRIDGLTQGSKWASSSPLNLTCSLWDMQNGPQNDVGVAPRIGNTIFHAAPEANELPFCDGGRF